MAALGGTAAVVSTSVTIATDGSSKGSGGAGRGGDGGGVASWSTVLWRRQLAAGTDSTTMGCCLLHLVLLALVILANTPIVDGEILRAAHSPWMCWFSWGVLMIHNLLCETGACSAGFYPTPRDITVFGVSLEKPSAPVESNIYVSHRRVPRAAC